jgi:hypothetical protein
MPLSMLKPLIGLSGGQSRHPRFLTPHAHFVENHDIG